ncbi:MAG: hypothetical protein WA001_00645 [Patescibacteria group bacterium]
MPLIVRKILAIGLFFAIAIGILFVMLKLWVAGQVKIGNGNIGMVKYVQQHQTTVILIFAGIWLLGLLVALPAMISGNFLQ